jgi:Zn-dependent peptidase ImmA (M78 family)
MERRWSSMSALDPTIKLDIKHLAREVRLKYADTILSTDVFEILNEESMLIRKPFESIGKFSGFTTFFEDQFVVYLNSSFTLGHERFTAAHELYHVLFDRDVLKRNKIIEEENVDIANTFATEFLMPEDSVKKAFYKKVGSETLEAKHIVRLHNMFKVSYRAMLKRLLELELCTKEKFSELEVFGFQEYVIQLQELTIKEGFTLDLITPSKECSIPQKFIDIIKDNYETKRISYGKFKSMLSFINKSPEDFGYAIPDEDNFL